jgi:NADH-quinone oxidoreductase subunit B
LEVKRQKLGAGADDFRIRQLRARQMLRGDLPDEDLEQFVRDSIALTTLEKAQNWARKNAMWPLGFGLACCAIEMITLISSPRTDLPTCRASAPRWCARRPGRRT